MPDCIPCERPTDAPRRPGDLGKYLNVISNGVVTRYVRVEEPVFCRDPVTGRCRLVSNGRYEPVGP
jgi:hypothetical protein